MDLKTLFNEFNVEHKQLNRVVTSLLEEGFSCDGFAMLSPDSLALSMYNATNSDAVFITCDDLNDPDSGAIRRGDKNLDETPPRIPLAGYQAPAYQ